MIARVEILALSAVFTIVAVACAASAGAGSSSAPMSSFPVLLPETSIVAVGTVTSVSDPFDLTTAEVPVQVYEAIFEIEDTLYGRERAAVTVRIPTHYLDSKGDPFTRTKIPNLRAGERTLLFLSGSSPYASPEVDTYVTAGGGVIPGKFTLNGSIVRSLFMDEPDTTLEVVEAWLS